MDHKKLLVDEPGMKWRRCIDHKKLLVDEPGMWSYWSPYTIDGDPLYWTIEITEEGMFSIENSASELLDYDEVPGYPPVYDTLDKMVNYLDGENRKIVEMEINNT